MAAHDETAASRLEKALARLWERSRFTSYFYQSVDLVEEPEVSLDDLESQLAALNSDSSDKLKSATDRENELNKKNEDL